MPVGADFGLTTDMIFKNPGEWMEKYGFLSHTLEIKLVI